MNLKERRAARTEARAKYVELIHGGMNPKQASAELDKWGKAKYGALPWADIFAFLKPLIEALIAKWLKV